MTDQANRDYAAALAVVRKIPNEKYRTAAADGLISCFIRDAKLQPDSPLAMQMRREAIAAGINL